MRKPSKKLVEKNISSNDSGEHSLKECPIFLTLSLIANKWSIRVLHSLLQAEKSTMRFGQIKKALPGITQRELTKHLRVFESCGIVDRKVFPEIPPRVEYTLTKLGHSLWKPIEELSSWAEKNAKFIQERKKSWEEAAAE